MWAPLPLHPTQTLPPPPPRPTPTHLKKRSSERGWRYRMMAVRRLISTPHASTTCGRKRRVGRRACGRGACTTYGPHSAALLAPWHTALSPASLRASKQASTKAPQPSAHLVYRRLCVGAALQDAGEAAHSHILAVPQLARLQIQLQLCVQGGAAARWK